VRFSKLPYEVCLIPCGVGDSFEVGSKKKVHVIELIHGNALCNGYVVREERSRLKAEFSNRLGEIPSLVRSGVVVNEPYLANLFAYTLDSVKFDIKQIVNADYWVADCTFLDNKDRDDPSHMSLPEVMQYASAAKVKTTFLAHISARYYNEDGMKNVREQTLGFNSGKIIPLFCSNINPIIY
jgi:ribonuclease BN (tRNA processing enzyme)